MIFISGGVRSGKSSFAEDLATSSPINLIYLATAINDGAEMDSRISKHKDDRKDKRFKTIECSYDLINVFDQLSLNDTVLLECLTTLVANEMFENNLSKEECITKVYNDIAVINNSVKELIIVSNDLYGEIYEHTKETKEYYSALCAISNKLVNLSDSAYELNYSLPVKRK